ncbi:MAG: nucleotide pyrophosphohydrolase [Candidatus Magasanikbacteria bacterium]|nr:nucleotide pyrophosphohydrolase [Candidatus Magasanikbacteria bacterium]
MSELKELTDKILEFRNARDWKQFHTPKDLAIGLTLEAGEVAEHFLWKNKEELQQHIENHSEEIGDELADVLYFLLLMANDFNIDLFQAAQRKIEKTAKKYPVEKAKGKHTKYTDL